MPALMPFSQYYRDTEGIVRRAAFSIANVRGWRDPGYVEQRLEFKPSELSEDKALGQTDNSSRCYLGGIEV